MQVNFDKGLGQLGHLREYVIWGFLLKFLPQSKAKEAHGKHGCYPYDRSCHAFIEALDSLSKRRWEFISLIEENKEWVSHANVFSSFSHSFTSLPSVFLKQSKVPA